MHHSDRGVHLSIRYTEHVAEVGGFSSVESRGDSYDNALAESVIDLYMTELTATRDHGAVSMSSSEPWNGSTGGTTAVFWSRIVGLPEIYVVPECNGSPTTMTALR